MTKKPFDIKERTFGFSVEIIKLTRVLPRTVDGIAVARQLIRCGTSVGANVEEADGAESKRDFIHKMSIARKEARETRYWLRVIQAASLATDPTSVAALIQESDELVRILSTIITNTRRNLEASSNR
jgi:four helix bundle protein